MLRVKGLGIGASLRKAVVGYVGLWFRRLRLMFIGLIPLIDLWLTKCFKVKGDPRLVKLYNIQAKDDC